MNGSLMQAIFRQADLAAVLRIWAHAAGTERRRRFSATGDLQNESCSGFEPLKGMWPSRHAFQFHAAGAEQQCQLPASGEAVHSFRGSLAEVRLLRGLRLLRVLGRRCAYRAKQICLTETNERFRIIRLLAAFAASLSQQANPRPHTKRLSNSQVKLGCTKAAGNGTSQLQRRFHVAGEQLLGGGAQYEADSEAVAAQCADAANAVSHPVFFMTRWAAPLEMPMLHKASHGRPCRTMKAPFAGMVRSHPAFSWPSAHVSAGHHHRPLVQTQAYAIAGQACLSLPQTALVAKANCLLSAQATY